jgi:ankyrin repeat protein
MKYLMNDLWVDANACTARGMTAVHYAAKANRVSSIRELAHAGAELDSYNDNGQVPAQMTKDRVIRRLFDKFSAGASDNSRR